MDIEVVDLEARALLVEGYCSTSSSISKFPGTPGRRRKPPDSYCYDLTDRARSPSLLINTNHSTPSYTPIHAADSSLLQSLYTLPYITSTPLV